MQPTRKTGLLWESVGDEIVVLDKNRNRAHRLNRPAGIVWRHADGKNTPAELAAIVGSELGAADNAAAIVDAALDRLGDLGLLNGPMPASISRRSMTRWVGAAAALAPLVVSIAVPTPARAASGPTSPPPPDF